TVHLNNGRSEYGQYITLDKGNHLNFSGACKVTEYLCSYLKRNFQLPNHHKDEKYREWEEKSILHEMKYLVES
ncbi:MAG: hypothetical protein Q4B70_13985, partial [Lachnospiraceae bacterium]|nr:hypothetical protein [Lachnospiraceae bacterium]